jgi:putative transposase
MSQRLTHATAAGNVSRRPYPSDPTDGQWRKVQPLLLGSAAPSGRPRSTNPREVLSALCYRWATGCAWRMLPHDFPPWGTVYSYLREWERAGIVAAVRDQLRRSRGR